MLRDYNIIHSGFGKCKDVLYIVFFLHTKLTSFMSLKIEKTIYYNCIIVFYKKYQAECLASKNVLRMQGGHKPFSYVAVSFSPEHYLMCSRFCLVWTLLL